MKSGIYYGRRARNNKSEASVNRYLVATGLPVVDVACYSLRNAGASYTRRNIIADCFRRICA